MATGKGDPPLKPGNEVVTEDSFIHDVVRDKKKFYRKFDRTLTGKERARFAESVCRDLDESWDVFKEDLREQTKENTYGQQTARIDAESIFTSWFKESRPTMRQLFRFVADANQNKEKTFRDMFGLGVDESDVFYPAVSRQSSAFEDGGVRREDRYRIEDDRSRSPVQHQTSTSSADTPPLPRHPSVSNVPSNGWPLKDIFFGVVALIVIVAPLCCLSSVIGYIGGMCGMEKSNIAQNLCAGWLGWIGLGILVCLPVLCWVVLLAWFLRGKSTHQQISPGLASSNGHHGQTGNSSASPVSNGQSQPSRSARRRRKRRNSEAQRQQQSGGTPSSRTFGGQRPASRSWTASRGTRLPPEDGCTHSNKLSRDQMSSKYLHRSRAPSDSPIPFAAKVCAFAARRVFNVSSQKGHLADNDQSLLREFFAAADDTPSEKFSCTGHSDATKYEALAAHFFATNVDAEDCFWFTHFLSPQQGPLVAFWKFLTKEMPSPSMNALLSAVLAQASSPDSQEACAEIIDFLAPIDHAEIHDIAVSLSGLITYFKIQALAEKLLHGLVHGSAASAVENSMPLSNESTGLSYTVRLLQMWVEKAHSLDRAPKASRKNLYRVLCNVDKSAAENFRDDCFPESRAFVSPRPRAPGAIDLSKQEGRERLLLAVNCVYGHGKEKMEASLRNVLVRKGLQLHGVHLTTEDCRAVGFVLTVYSEVIMVVDLHDCQMGDTGYVELEKGLSQCSLTEIDLDGNGLAENRKRLIAEEEDL